MLKHPPDHRPWEENNVPVNRHPCATCPLNIASGFLFAALLRLPEDDFSPGIFCTN
jgi:hypothetical protein